MRSTDVLTALRRRWSWPVAGVAVGLIIAGLVALNTTPRYTGTAQVLVTAVAVDSSTSDLAQGGTFVQQQVITYARLANTRAVLQPVVDQLGLTESVGDLAGRVSADAPVNTSLISINAADSDPTRAADIANAVAQSLTDVIPRLAQAGDGAPTPVRGTVIEAAQPATVPASPNVRLYVVVGLLLGLAAGAGAGLLRERTDTRLRDSAGLAGVSQVPVLGVMPAQSHSRREAVHQAQAVEQREALRHLRASVTTALRARGGSAVLITEPLPTGSRSELAHDLAAVCAASGQRVLYVDADLAGAASDQQHGPLSLRGYLSGALDARQAVAADDSGSLLTVVSAGPLSSGSAVAVDAERMRAFIDAARDLYDLVVVQAPPLLPYTDAAVLGQVTDGVVMVIHAGRVRQDDLRDACARLDAVGAVPLGFVLDGAVPTPAQQRRRSALARSLEQG